MKKFRFSLSSVQTVRNIRELRARERFSEALHAVAQAEAALTAARDELAELERVMGQRRQGTFRPAEQVAYLNEYQVQRERVKQAEGRLAKARTALAQARDEWIRARRDVRVIENLEVKARQEYRREVEHEEQALLDDRANATAGRAPLLTP